MNGAIAATLFRVSGAGAKHNGSAKNVSEFLVKKYTWYIKIYPRIYELYQAKNSKFCQPRMPHAILVAARMSHIWYYAHGHEQWKRVAASFSVKDLGLALAPKMCPDQSQAFKEVNNSHAFIAGRKKMALFF